MPREQPSRRWFLAASVAAVAGLGGSVAWLRRRAPQAEGRLLARPVRPTGSVQPGQSALNLGAGRDAQLFVPALYRPDRPAPFVLALHGAGGDGEGPMWLWREIAEARGLIVLAPDSRGRTWDGVRGGFGPDVTFIDRALAAVFGRCAVDPNRLAVSGFSDGASYALSLGLVNGDLFRKVVAFSPGFIVPAEWRGTPQFFVSHGRGDRILPIDVAGRRIVTMLQRGGYGVRYREFEGGHTIPAQVRDEAVEWMLAK